MGNRVGKGKIYNRENLIGPFLVHKRLGPRPPPPPLTPAQKTSGGGGGGQMTVANAPSSRTDPRVRSTRGSLFPLTETPTSIFVAGVNQKCPGEGAACGADPVGGAARGVGGRGHGRQRGVRNATVRHNGRRRLVGEGGRV